MTDACHIWNVTISPLGPWQRPRQSSWKNVVLLQVIQGTWMIETWFRCSFYTYPALHIDIRISLWAIVPRVSCFYLKSSIIMFSLLPDATKKRQFPQSPFQIFPGAISVQGDYKTPTSESGISLGMRRHKKEGKMWVFLINNTHVQWSNTGFHTLPKAAKGKGRAVHHSGNWGLNHSILHRTSIHLKWGI